MQEINLKPNVLFIVIDSLRADKIFGKQKTSVTPNIDNLTKKSAVFSNAFSCSDGTLSSVTSIFTSKFFFRTGVSIKNNYNLDKDTQSCTKVLQKEGYSTIGLIQKINFLKHITKNFQNEDNTYDYYQNLSQGLGDRIIKKIESFDNKPWFYYIHINDLHLPNWPSQEFDKKEFGVSRYERVVSQVDYWIGKILNSIDKENTIVILTADHGEFVHCVQIDDEIINFEPHSSQKFLRKISKILPTKVKKSISFHIFDRSEKQTNDKKIKKMNLDLTNSQKRTLLHTRSQLDHYLHDDLIHIPLIISGPNIKTGKIDDIARTIDIFPTILDLLQIKYNENIDGQSLIPIINGKKLAESYVYMERDLMLRHSELDVCGIRTSDYKYFRAVSDSTKKNHLYDLKKDPLEENNIAQDEIKLVEKMEIKLKKIHEGTIKKTNNDLDEHDEKIKEELRKLGYL